VVFHGLESATAKESVATSVATVTITLGSLLRRSSNVDADLSVEESRALELQSGLKRFLVGEVDITIAGRLAILADEADLGNLQITEELSDVLLCGLVAQASDVSNEGRVLGNGELLANGTLTTLTIAALAVTAISALTTITITALATITIATITAITTAGITVTITVATIAALATVTIATLATVTIATLATVAIATFATITVATLATITVATGATVTVGGAAGGTTGGLVAGRAGRSIGGLLGGGGILCGVKGWEGTLVDGRLGRSSSSTPRGLLDLRGRGLSDILAVLSPALGALGCVDNKSPLNLRYNAANNAHRESKRSQKLVLPFYNLGKLGNAVVATAKKKNFEGQKRETFRATEPRL
jgi:hypothetical protein